MRGMSVELPRRILIVRMGAIGDVVNALVLANAIKDFDRSVRIGWAVHELSEPLVRSHPSIDRVHLWRKKSGLSGLSSVVREIRVERYELAIDLQRIVKSALVARLSGARRVLGFDRARTKEGSWLAYRERIAASDPSAHMVEQYLEFARHLGLDGARARLDLPRDSAAEARAEEWTAGFAKPPVLVNLGASQPAKRWNPERFGELARRAAERFDRPVILVGGPGDRAVADVAKTRIDGDRRVVDLVGNTSLAELAALERRAALLVTADSGPMHVAVAVGTPVVALFGPGEPRRTGPFGDRSIVVREPPPCAPCNRRVCNQSRHHCMEDITVEHVLAAIEALLSR